MKHSLFIVACINIIIFGPATLPTSIAVQEIEEIESVSQEEPRLDFINDNTNNQEVNRHELTEQSSEKLELNSHEPHIEDFDKETLNEIEPDKGEEYYKDDINEQDLVKQEQNSRKYILKLLNSLSLKYCILYYMLSFREEKPCININLYKCFIGN